MLPSSGVTSTLLDMGMPWSPMQAVRRTADDEWTMYDDGERIAIIKRVRIGKPSTWYFRSVTGDQNPQSRTLLGYFPTLDFAATVTWRLWDQHGRIQVEKQFV